MSDECVKTTGMAMTAEARDNANTTKKALGMTTKKEIDLIGNIAIKGETPHVVMTKCIGEKERKKRKTLTIRRTAKKKAVSTANETDVKRTALVNGEMTNGGIENAAVAVEVGAKFELNITC
jgi:hypothetical protein